jgi:hypothetical protein
LLRYAILPGASICISTVTLDHLIGKKLRGPGVYLINFTLCQMEEEKRKMFETQQPADVILLTSDGVSLRVHKCLLAVASSIFQQMFSLPQPGPDSKADSLPSVEVTETSEVMTELLQFIYPNFDSDDPEFWFPKGPDDEALWRLDKVYVAADKYEMSWVKRSIVRILCNPRVAFELPFDCYAFAIQHGESILKLQALIHSMKRNGYRNGNERSANLGTIRKIIINDHLSALGHFELTKDFDGEQIATNKQVYKFLISN